jgi:hypothetical protein
MHRAGCAFVRLSDRPPPKRVPLGEPSTSDAPCSVHGDSMKAPFIESSAPHKESSAFSDKARCNRLRSWRRGSGADRQVALGGTPLQDTKRCDRGRPRGTSTRRRRTCEALEGRPCRRHDRGDGRHEQADAGRDGSRGAPRSRERGRDDVYGDTRVTGGSRAARQGAEARSPAWGRPRGASHEAGSASTRRSAPWAAALNAPIADQPLRHHVVRWWHTV